MKATRRFLLVIALIVTTSLSWADEKPWREVRSPNFRVITIGSESAGKRVAREFEQMRAVFAERFSTFHLDSAAPLTILAVEDEATTKKLLPEFWKTNLSKPSGFYMHGWDRKFALVRLDVTTSDRINPDVYAVVYHEYLHSLLHLNFRWIPTWLDEGLAEFYAYTRFEKDKTYIGAPPRNVYIMRILESRASIPLTKFLEQRGSFSHDDRDTAMFYAQSWALTHFLTMGSGMDNGDRMVRFLNALRVGTDQKKAFEDSFGPLDQVQKDFDSYLRRYTFQAGIINNPPQADDKDYQVCTLTLPETHAELAAFYQHTNQRKAARELAEGAVKADPKLADAYQTLGFVSLDEGKDEEAIKHFTSALELNDRLYLARFARAKLSAFLNPGDARILETNQAEMMKVLDSNPRFAAAYIELARIFVTRGNLERALALSRTAEKLEPWWDSYHTYTGQILLRMKRPAEAAAVAAYVVSHFPDNNEAMELWEHIPADQRPANGPAEAPLPKDVSQTEGTVKSIECGEGKLTILLDKAGQQLKFRFDRRISSYADTLWMGQHQMSPCYHLTGLRAVVNYKADKDPSYNGEAVRISFREDLPAPIVAQAGASTPAAQGANSAPK